METISRTKQYLLERKAHKRRERMYVLQEYATYALILIVGYLTLDLLMFFAWVMSEQLPHGFYVGWITEQFLRLVVGL